MIGGILHNLFAFDAISTSFRAALQSTLVPEYSIGSGTPTLTRATTAYVTDFEGLLKPVLSGEARFTGARRVRNRIATSSATLASGSANTMTLEAGTYVFSMGAGTGTATFSGTGGATGTLVADASSRTAITKTVTAGTFIVTASVANLVNLQTENVTGQANQNPSEYVSVGVLSAPFHGANVDGVKYFTTQNGNTVASNVVTEATGAAIAAATLKGYLAEGARTNLHTYSEQFFTFYNYLTGMSAVADQTAAPDGAVTADKLLEDAISSEKLAAKTAYSFTSGPYTYSVYAKPDGRNFIALGFYDGAGSYETFFNLSTGAVGTNAAGNTAVIQALANGWYLCAITRTLPTTAGGQARLGMSADGTSKTYTGDGVSGIYVWGGHLEAGAFASSYIPTTTVAVTRDADFLTYPFAGNGNRLTGTWYAEVLQESSDIASNPAIATWVYSDGVGNAGMMLRRSVGKGTLFSGGSGVITDVPTANTIAAGVLTKLAGSFSGTAALVSANGGAAASGTFTPAAADPVTLYIGSNSSTTSQIDGTVRNVRIYGTQFTAAQLQALTA